MNGTAERIIEAAFTIAIMGLILLNGKQFGKVITVGSDNYIKLVKGLQPSTRNQLA